MISANTMDHCARQAALSVGIPSVYIVDGDVEVRRALAGLVEIEGWQPETFASADAFLARSRARVPGCLLLDADLPRCRSLEVQRQVAIEHPDMPIIFITGRGDIGMTVQAMKAGAAEFLMKPLDEHVLVRALRYHIAHSAAALRHRAELEALRQRYHGLSGRERQVMELVVSGRLNKQIGCELGISEITVKAHRGRVMRKMDANSVVDLVHIALRLARSAPQRALPSSDRPPVNAGRDRGVVPRGYWPTENSSPNTLVQLQLRA